MHFDGHDATVDPFEHCTVDRGEHAATSSVSNING
jgi:hypothetical protein